VKLGLVIFVVFLLAFGGTLVGILAATGQLSKEALDKLRSGQTTEEHVDGGPAGTDPLDVWVKQQKDREQELEAERTRLEEEARRNEIVRGDMENLLLKLEQMTQGSSNRPSKEQENAGDTAEDKGLQEAARTLASMKPTQAAAAMDKMEDLESAAAYLRTMEEDERAAILDKMKDASKVVQLLQYLKEGE